MRELSSKAKNGGKKCVEVAAKFPRQLDRHQLARVVLDLLKYLLYQTRQIPLQYDLLIKEHEKHLDSTNKENSDKNMDFQEENKMEKPASYSGLDRRKQILLAKKLEREVKRAKKIKAQFWKKADKFLEKNKELMSKLEEEILQDGDNITSVRFQIGATIVSPRITFNIIFPPKSTDPILAGNGHHGNFRPGLYLFRALVTSSELDAAFQSQRLPLTNLFAFIEKAQPKSNESWLVPCNRHPTVSSDRCVSVTINLEIPHLSNCKTPANSKMAGKFKPPLLLDGFDQACSPSTLKTKLSNRLPCEASTIKRLRFDSGCRSTGENTRELSPMVLCTPAPPIRAHQDSNHNHPDGELNLDSSVYGLEDSKLALDTSTTDLGGRRRRWSSSIMELCTPYTDQKGRQAHYNYLEQVLLEPIDTPMADTSVRMMEETPCLPARHQPSRRLNELQRPNGQRQHRVTFLEVDKEDAVNDGGRGADADNCHQTDAMREEDDIHEHPSRSFATMGTPISARFCETESELKNNEVRDVRNQNSVEASNGQTEAVDLATRSTVKASGCAIGGEARDDELSEHVTQERMDDLTQDEAVESELGGDLVEGVTHELVDMELCTPCPNISSSRLFLLAQNRYTQQRVKSTPSTVGRDPFCTPVVKPSGLRGQLPLSVTRGHFPMTTPCGVSSKRKMSAHRRHNNSVASASSTHQDDANGGRVRPVMFKFESMIEEDDDCSDDNNGGGNEDDPHKDDLISAKIWLQCPVALKGFASKF